MELSEYRDRHKHLPLERSCRNDGLLMILHTQRGIMQLASPGVQQWLRVRRVKDI